MSKKSFDSQPPLLAVGTKDVRRGHSRNSVWRSYRFFTLVRYAVLTLFLICPRIICAVASLR